MSSFQYFKSLSLGCPGPVEADAKNCANPAQLLPLIPACWRQTSPTLHTTNTHRNRPSRSCRFSGWKRG